MLVISYCAVVLETSVDGHARFYFVVAGGVCFLIVLACLRVGTGLFRQHVRPAVLVESGFEGETRTKCCCHGGTMFFLQHMAKSSRQRRFS